MNANWSDYERFLKPVHLNGKAVTLTIVKATEEETHPQKGKAVSSPVLWFREKPFGLILSPTNRATLIALYGDPITNCIGKPITVHAVAMKVGGNDKQPIRILNKRPAAPSIDVATGEIVPPAASGVVTLAAGDAATTPAPSLEEPRGPDWPAGLGDEQSELDAHFGTSKITAPQTPGVVYPILPTTEAEFTTWLREKGINGKETHTALGTDAKSWLKANPGRTWGDVAKAVAGVLGK